jgi:hypothetical protein
VTNLSATPTVIHAGQNLCINPLCGEISCPLQIVNFLFHLLDDGNSKKNDAVSPDQQQLDSNVNNEQLMSLTPMTLLDIPQRNMTRVFEETLSRLLMYPITTSCATLSINNDKCE